MINRKETEFYIEPAVFPAALGDGGNIPVILACSNGFVPHAAQAVQSLIEHSSSKYNYDLIFLHAEIEDNNQRLIKEMAQEYPNISIRFFNIKDLLAGRKMHTYDRFNEATYYRLCLPELIRGYDKVIYLDSDITVLRDVAELMEINIGDNLLGAALDLGMVSRCYTEKFWHDYVSKTLQADINSYFQAGVLVFNLSEFRKAFRPDELLEMAIDEKYIWVDQDILNSKCGGHFYILDAKWDVLIDSWGLIDLLKVGPASFYDAYMRALKDPYIVHHAGDDKPWLRPDIPFASFYWKYARKTPFYELVLYRMILGNQGLTSSPYRSKARKLADKLMPKGTRRREFAKKLLPKDSRRWNFCKKIYYSIFRG